MRINQQIKRKISTAGKLIISLLAVVFSFWGCEQSDPPVLEQQLVWADEFDGSSLDTARWDIQIGDGSAYGLWQWGNNEDQYYRKENLSVANGRLRIKAVAEQFGGYDYTSGRIRSLGSGEIKYGRVEASIKMPAAGGLWHAFWMLPSSPDAVWPMGGEIDIMEYVGNNPGYMLQTIHFADRFGSHAQLGNEFALLPSDFHEYAMEWDENKIIWFIDDTEVFRVLRSNPSLQTTWPFDASFHVLLNTAVGGNLGGSIDAQALQTPRFMEVDYVRLYQWN